MRKKIFSLIVIFIVVSSVLLSSFFSRGYNVKADSYNGDILHYGEVVHYYGKNYFSAPYCLDNNTYELYYIKVGNAFYYDLEIRLYGDSDVSFDLTVEGVEDAFSWRYFDYSGYYIPSTYRDGIANLTDLYYTTEYDNSQIRISCVYKSSLGAMGQFRAYLKYGVFMYDEGVDDYEFIDLYDFSIVRNFITYPTFEEHYLRGYNSGYDEGDRIGYDRGYNEGTADTETAQYWFTGLFEGFQGFLNIEIMGISLGTIILIPFAITFVWFIIRQFRGGGSS